MKGFLELFRKFTVDNKYELLLIGLIQHLFIGLVLRDMDFYAEVIWPMTMIVLGVASVGIFSDKGKNEILIRNILLVAVIALPIMANFFPDIKFFLKIVSIVYSLFFAYIFYEVFKFLIKPDKFNTDVLSAAGCGYLLIIEIFTFWLQYLYYDNPACLTNINSNTVSETFMDLVYFTTISITTIGFGDITPNTHYTRLLVSIMGLLGQFYTVVLTGILVSNFAPNLLKGKKKI